jgi:2-methylisocitrate lyase-like PEP mutase family enzyme
MNDSADRARAFRELHQQPGTFIIPNPWDAGSAVLLQRAGAVALATTSAGYAFSTARADGAGAIGRDEVLAHSRDIIAATPLPVSADLENCYGDDPETCAETIRLAGETGLSGGSIEDVTGDPASPIYPFDLALERVRAAVEAARGLPVPFTLCARADNLIHGRPDLGDTIRRLEAFADAGADVLYAPGLKTRDEVLAVVKAVAPKPVNVVVGLAGANFTVAELAELGVKRISLGSTLARLIYGRLMSAAKEMFEDGSFSFGAEAAPFGEINSVFRQHS